MGLGRTVLANRMDWIAFFLVSTAAALPGLPLLWWLMRRNGDEARPA